MSGGIQSWIYPVGFIIFGWLGLWLLKISAIASVRLIERLFFPLERSVLQWLQDRAMARSLGIDIDIIRVRRKIEIATKPIDVPTSDGAKRHR